MRRLLFPALSPEEGWERIDRATRGAGDDEHWAAIEETAKQEHLSDDLLSRLRKLREKSARASALPGDLHGANLDAYVAGYRAATDALWWDSAEAAFNSSSMRGELQAAFVRGWEDGKAKVTPAAD